jgi:hypothetical protein
MLPITPHRRKPAPLKTMRRFRARSAMSNLPPKRTSSSRIRPIFSPICKAATNSEATLQYLLGLGGQNPGAGGTSTGAGQTLSIPGVNGSVSIPGVTTTTGTASTGLGAYGSLMQGYGGGAFQAPTAAQAQATPGYQFGLQQGEGAQQASAAANGSLLTGGTQAALDQYGQNYADTNYNNVYNQALQTYGTNYNVWANQQASEYNKLASMAGAGQTTAQTLNQQGLQSTGQIASTLGQTGRTSRSRTPMRRRLRHRVMWVPGMLTAGQYRARAAISANWGCSTRS